MHVIRNDTSLKLTGAGEGDNRVKSVKSAKKWLVLQLYKAKCIQSFSEEKKKAVGLTHQPQVI